MNVVYYELQVKTRAGVQTALFSSSAPRGGLVSCAFDIKRDGGCQDMEFVVPREHNKGAVAAGSLVTFSAVTTTQAKVAYWVGVITSTPKLGNTNRLWRYEARGLFDAEIARQLLVKYYEGQDVDDLVLDILADIDTPTTAVSTSTSEISIATPYTVADFESEFDDASAAIQQLALLQGSTEYGVDQNGKLYFRDYSTSNVIHLWVGKGGLTEIDVREDTDGIINDVYVASKQIVGGGSLYLHRADATSKTAYGQKSKTVQFRNSKDPDDVARYGDSIIARFKNPARHVDTKLPSFSNFIFPRGNVRITDTDGTTVYTFPVLRVKYAFSKAGGLVGEMEVGDRILPTLDENVRDVARRIELATSASVSLTKIEHTGGEEFAQQALVDARKNGYLNTFFDTVNNDKVWNRAISRGIYIYNNELLDDPHAPDGFSVELRSNIIPTGDVPATVRLGTYVDVNGRVTFGHDTDVQTFFESGAGNPPTDWRVDQNLKGMENFQNGNAVYYVETPGGGFQLHVNHGVAIRWNDAGVNSAGGTYPRVLFGYVDNLNYNYIEIVRAGGSLTVDLYKAVAGVHTLQDTLPVTEGIDDYVLVVSYVGGSGHRLEVWDKDYATLLHNGAYRTLAVPASSRAGLWQWWDGTVGVRGRLGWFEVENPGAGGGLLCQISRNGGGAYASAITLIGGWHRNPYITFQDVSLAAIASGDELVAYFTFVHPHRLKGWSLSWGS